MEHSVLRKPQGENSAENTKPQAAAPPAFWFAPPDESDLLRAVVNDYDAATRVLPTFDARALTNDTARRLFGACRAVWQTGEPLRPESLATYCEAQADAADTGTENGLWCECVEIARSDLATAPTAPDLAKEADAIAKRLSKVPRFEFLGLCEVLNRPDPAFLIDRLLTVGGTSILTAKHASFKSFFALDMALCVATGRPFHGFKCERGGVIYIAAEGAAGLKKRAAAWLEHHAAAPPADFVILDKPFQVANADQRAAFAKATETLMPQLIVLDTLARCAVGLDENNAGDMGTFADALGALARETGAHVLTVHHNNKNGDYRGSSALPAAVDTHLALERHKETDAVTLTTEKQKDAEELRPLLFEKIEVALPNTGGLGHSLVFAKVETAPGAGFGASVMEQKVFGALELIATETGVSSAQWKAAADESGVSNGAFYMAVKRLLKPVSERGLGLVTVVSGEHGKRGALYAPTLQNAPNGVLEQTELS